MKKISLAPRHAPRSIAVALFTALIICLVCPAVSAIVIVDEDLSTYTDTSKKGIHIGPGGTEGYGTITSLTIKDIGLAQSLGYIIVDYPGNCGAWTNGTWITEGRHDFIYSIADYQNLRGVLYLSHTKNVVGTITNTRYVIFLNDWDVQNLTGSQSVELPFRLSRYQATFCGAATPAQTGDLNIFYPYNIKNCDVSIAYTTGIEWKCHVNIDKDTIRNGYDITVSNLIDGMSYTSRACAIKNNVEIDNRTGCGNDIKLWYPIDDIDTLIVSPLSGKVFKYSLGPDTPPDSDDPDDHNVIVYIKNSQTGALIADANIVIDALVNGEYYTVVNRTEPSGIFSITLQPTGGGQPNPDGYRLIATADGYNNPMPEINFTVDDYKLSIHCLLDPIAGGPENENKTFIDFFVRDMSSNPISGATVKFGKYTLITNSQGYTVFEVDKNNNYVWTISKSGYGPLTGNAVIGDAPRHTINTVLAPAVTPTPQTPIPTGPAIGPKPTMTAPTGETVSNWLEWFAAHFGMILGGGAEIGKIFMWLCFAVPVGVYVGKEAKAGAAGFMAGAGIVTLFFVLIGWVPIWLLVLLALIIGLLYAKVFNTPDNGGGR